MAASKCSKCGAISFEVVEATPKNSTYKLMFVQCSICGAVVGSMSYFDAGYLAKRNQEELEQIKQVLHQIEDLLSRLQR